MRNLSAVVVTVSVMFGVACGSSGARSTNAFFSVDDTRKSLISARDQVNRTAQSLEKLLTQSGDAQPAYKEFSGNVDRMNEQAREVEKRANEMRDKRSAYLDQWSKETKAIKDDEIARLAAVRREQMDRDYTSLLDSMAEAKQALVPYMQGLNDVRTYLKNDLTATGIQSIRPSAERILSNGSTVNQSLDRAEAALSGVSAALQPRT